MRNHRRTPGLCFRLAGSIMVVLAASTLPSPLTAQGGLGDAVASRSGMRVQVTAAALFANSAADIYCPIGKFVDATQFAVRVYDAGARRIKGFGAEVTYVADGQFPWPWAENARISQDHDGGLRVTGNVYVSASRGERVDVDLVAGAGIRRYNEGDGVAEYEGGAATGIYRIQSQTSPIATYGLLVDVSLTDALSLQGQARANTTFSGDIDVLGPQGEAQTVAAGTQTFLQLTAGIGFRVGGR